MNDPTSENGAWFQSVVGRYEGPLVRFAARITGDVDRARDVVQDAFLRLHEQNGGRPENVQAWLYTVCRRRALDVLRKETRMTTMDASAAAVCEYPDQSKSATAQRETQDAVLALVDGLPGNQQEVVRLKFQDGLSYRDIAAVTGLSVSNVGYLLHTAVKKLREHFASGD